MANIVRHYHVTIYDPETGEVKEEEEKARSVTALAAWMEIKGARVFDIFTANGRCYPFTLNS